MAWLSFAGALAIWLLPPFTSFGGFGPFQASPKQDKGQQAAVSGQDSAAPPSLSAAEQRKLEGKLLKGLKDPYKKWLTEDVAYIAFPEERLQFLQLRSDAEREDYITQFWLRRDPTPETPVNELKDEHYRRIEYANLRFPAGVKGWRTDRGLFYILYGPPDEIQHNEGAWSSPEGLEARMVEQVYGTRGSPVPSYPFEKWRYRYISGVGFNIELEFVDTTSTGRYDLAADPGEKYGYVPIPGGLYHVVSQGLIPTDLTRAERMDLRYRQIVRMVNQGKLLKVSAEPEGGKAKPTEEVVTSRLVRNLLPVQVRVDFFRGRDQQSVAVLGLCFAKSDLKFIAKEGGNRAHVNLRGSVTDSVGRPVARIEQGIEWRVSETWLRSPGPAAFAKPLELPPGRYQFTLELEDAASGNASRVEQPLEVPDFYGGQLAASSLILLRRAPAPRDKRERAASTGEPSFDGPFSRAERIGLYLEVYNLGMDSTAKKRRATVEYLISRGDQVVFRQTEESADLGPEKQRFTLTKTISLADVEPGEYLLKVRIIDPVLQQTVETVARFTVIP